MHNISSDVLFSDRYLQPQDKKHFCWQDFYSVIAEYEERLAHEFVDFMYSWGMSPPEPIVGWEDLYTNPETAKKFRQQWEKVKSHFSSLGAKCYKNGSDPFGFNISYPVSWLHLIYLSVDREFSTLKANIWFLENSPYLNAFLNIDEKLLSSENCQIFVLGVKPSKAPWKLQSNISPMFVAQYETALSNILYLDSLLTQKALLDFAIAVFEHTQKVVGQFSLLEKNIIHL